VLRAAPRSFQGKMDARFIDFMRSYALSLVVEASDEEELLSVASAIAKAFAQLGKGDLGLVQNTQRDTAMEIVVTNGGRIEWLDTWQDLLGFKFPTIGAETRVEEIARRSILVDTQG
jgi:hypothetical protein